MRPHLFERPYILINQFVCLAIEKKQEDVILVHVLIARQGRRNRRRVVLPFGFRVNLELMLFGITPHARACLLPPSLRYPPQGNFGTPLGFADLGSLHEGEYLQRLIRTDWRDACAQEFCNFNQ